MIYLLILIIQLVFLYFLSRKVLRRFYIFFYHFTKRKNWSVSLFAILFLPGTFIHEMSHFLAALFLLVPVGKIELLPKVNETGQIDLGSVAIGKSDPLRRFLVGIAPVIFGFFIIVLILYLITTPGFINTWWGYVLAGFLIFEIANSMFASKKDLEGALGLLAFFVFIYIFMMLTGINFPFIKLEAVYSNEIIKMIQLANLFLIVPIFLDSFAFLLLKLVTKRYN